MTHRDIYGCKIEYAMDLEHQNAHTRRLLLPLSSPHRGSRVSIITSATRLGTRIKYASRDTSVLVSTNSRVSEISNS